MELIYVWVDEYKNLKKQGFNFNSKFRCKYDNEANKLEIKENQNNIDIFSKNISIKAIVGQNGSGKTSLLEFIMLLVFKSENSNKKLNGFAIAYEDKKFYIFYRGSNNISFKEIYIHVNDTNSYSNNIGECDNHFCFKNQNSPFFNIYYNPSSELVSTSFLQYTFKGLQEFYASIYDFDFKPLDQNNLIAFPFKNKGILDINFNEKFTIVTMFKNMDLLENIQDTIKKELSENKLFFVPKEFIIKFNIDELRNKIIKSYNSLDCIESFFEQIIKNNKVSIIDLTKILFLGVLSISQVFEDFKQYFFKKNSKINDFLKNLSNDHDITNYYQELINFEDKQIENLLNSIDLKNELIEQNHDSILNIEISNLAGFIDVLKRKKFNFHEKIGFLEFSYENSNSSDLIEILKTVPLSFDIEIYDKDGVLYNDFSFGEKSIIAILNIIMYFVVNFSKNGCINVFIDEMEIGLNPEWQRKLISVLVEEYSVVLKYLKKENNKNFSINFIIATHSPFILSDIPKEYVIFLENGRQVNKFYKNENTFGANIYDIFEKGFFLENSIGKYSEEWIKALDLILSFFNSYKLANKGNVFPLRNLLKRWYVSKNKNGELSEKEMKQQDDDLLSEKKEELLKKLFEKNEIEYEKFKFLIDEEFNLRSEIKNYIEIIGDEIVRNHLLDLYERVKNESK